MMQKRPDNPVKVPLTDGTELAGGGFAGMVNRISVLNEESAISVSACSWDCSVRVWKVGCQGAQISNSLIKTFSYDVPVLDTAFNGDGTQLFFGACDNVVAVHDLTRDAPMQKLGNHNGAVCRVRFSKEPALVASGSWDGKIRLWDGKSQSPALELCMDKIVAMDFLFPWLAACTVSRNISFWDLRSGPSKQNVRL